MCGIAAVFSGSHQLRASPIASVLASLQHRGPDGIGAGATGRALLGHTRLAIVDVAGGAQPMRGEDQRFALVCNGEIYNHARLRERLASSHRLRTRSDSEVVLHLYEDLGAGCVHELDGMFAFFATDGTRFVAARDALGIKPMYVGWDSKAGHLWFGSEFKALLGRCDGFGALPPGSYLTQSGEMERWFCPRWETQVGEAHGTPKELKARLEAAVVKRLMSAVPLGVFLSGGLDSSIVAALAKNHIAQLETFSVGLDGAPDLEAAREVARALGTRHRQCVYAREEIGEVLEQVIYHLESYDAALVRSAIPCYLVSRLAAQTVKVVLTGEGADELFGGYGYFGSIRDPEVFHRECVKLLLNLHGMNLQRVDRMTMAHGLEGRVPFLDLEFVAWSMDLDPRLKLWESGGLEKGLLRAAFSELLPRAVLHRNKLEFSAGSGIDGAVALYAEQRVSDRDLANASALFPNDTPLSKEELLYRRLFEDAFPGHWPRASVQRWRHTATPTRTQECQR